MKMGFYVKNECVQLMLKKINSQMDKKKLNNGNQHKLNNVKLHVI